MRRTKLTDFTPLQKRNTELEAKLAEAQRELAQWHEGDTECCLQRHEAQCARAELDAEVERLRAEVEHLTDRDKRSDEAISALTEQRNALVAEVERLRAAHGEACQLVARMHEAAVGEVRGPSVGVVEDVAALRAEVERLRAALVDIESATVGNGICDSLDTANWPCPWCEVERLRGIVRYLRGILDELDYDEAGQPITWPSMERVDNALRDTEQAGEEGK